MQKFTDESQDYKTYLVDYRYKGSTWCLELKATSWEDARARLRCLVNASVEGELALKVYVSKPLATRIMEWLGIKAPSDL
jgi:hypothetical protein